MLVDACGSATSGLLMYAYETSAAASSLGFQDSRWLYESRWSGSKFVRTSLGSRPVNVLASSLKRELGAKPTVATPNWMCEASASGGRSVDSGMS